MEIWSGWGGCYHRRLAESYRYLVPPGQAVIEIGCARGDLLARLGRFAAQSGVEHLVAIGEYAARITSAAVAAGLPSAQAVTVTAKADAVAVVASDLGPGDVVLVKASRGLALDTVADEILAAVGPPPHQDAV